MVQKFVIIGFLVVILYNLGSGLYYMMVDKGESDRMVKALTWRIALSIALIAIIGIGIWTGWIQPHDVGR
ncbi:MAG TPA: twin transmembrane helix small protein [Xanthomonadaceae bacterium]|jgi:succinate dehydrogenase/fumarate reductase cytochrome b subunit